MQKSGELKKVMENFEKNITKIPVYLGAEPKRAERVLVETENGGHTLQYKNQNYYDNGHVNELFIMYLSGYAYGKCVHI